MKRVINDSDMIYYISMLSTTGGKLKVVPEEILEKYKLIKSIKEEINVIIGFGITPENISEFKQSDSVVVGSFLCNKIEESINNNKDPSIEIGKTISELNKGLIK
jgi:tryptophan synthase alpha chain